MKISPRRRGNSIGSHRLVTPPSKKTPCAATKIQREADTISKKRPLSVHTAATMDITAISPTSMTSKQDLVASVLATVRQDEDEKVRHHSPHRSFSAIDDDDNDGNESVGSIGRILIMSPGGVYKKMGGRWDSNLLEDSMPGLVSFCHGSFASEGLASVVADDDSVSSLECSIMNSQHSNKNQLQNSSHHDSTLETSSEHSKKAKRDTTSSACDNVLQPLARIQPDDKHQEVRWGGSVHRSSDSLPVLSHRVRRREPNRTQSYYL